MKLSEAIRLLSDAGIEEARAEARIIFSRLGSISEHELLFDPESNCGEVSRLFTKGVGVSLSRIFSEKRISTAKPIRFLPLVLFHAPKPSFWLTML